MSLGNENISDEEAQASLVMWRYVFGFSEMAAIKCAIDLKIPEAIENHPSSPHPVTLCDLSSAVSASPSHLHRVMRFLVHQGIFQELPTKDGIATGYTNTPLSRRFMITKRDDKSLAAFVLLETAPEMIAPWLRLSSVVTSSASDSRPPFDAVHGKDVWSLAENNGCLSQLINESMACDTRRVVPGVVRACREVFDGVNKVVDLGGGNGETLGIVVKEFPGIKGVNFDLPHVIQVAQVLHGVENVAGDMFRSIPQCDAVLIKWVLHDWGDEECIKILKNCKEAIPNKTGKVLIVESVIGEKKRDEKLEYVRLMLDMVMMAHTSTGKERTLKEWAFVLNEAGFARYEIRDINDVQSVIIAYQF